MSGTFLNEQLGIETFSGSGSANHEYHFRCGSIFKQRRRYLACRDLGTLCDSIVLAKKLFWIKSIPVEC